MCLELGYFASSLISGFYNDAATFDAAPIE